jgi:nicotinamidase-related amidase
MKMTTALLVIDMQQSLLEEAYEADRVLTTVADVIDAARQAGILVIYLRHAETSDQGPLQYGTPAWEIHPAIAPHADDVVLDKQWPDSFYRTTLGGELSARGVTHLVITGMATEQCVDMTSRGAWQRGYDVTVVADGHTTVDYPGAPPAPVRIAYHNLISSHIGNPEHKITVVPAAELRF